MVILEPFPLQAVPLQLDGAGGYRVGKSRVPLDWVIDAYNQGETAEAIAHTLSDLSLAEIHAVLSYYLSHQDFVNNHLTERRREAAETRRTIEALCPPLTRTKLLSRRAPGIK